MSFNQFLIEDEHPALIHTGTYPMYEDVRQAMAEVLDPRRLDYIIVPHFEADECGGMGGFVTEARAGGGVLCIGGGGGERGRCGSFRPLPGGEGWEGRA